MPAFTNGLTLLIATGVKVANRGISGDTTRGVLIRLEEDVLARQPPGAGCHGCQRARRGRWLDGRA